MATDLTPTCLRWCAMAVTAIAAQVHAAAEAALPFRSQCEIGAFVQETDPAGLNVRAAPSAHSRVLGKLVPVYMDPDQGYRTRAEVDVVASERGWFLIRNARDNPDLSGQAERPMYQGEGWVSGSRLIVKSQATVGRAAPTRQAPEALRFRDEDSFDSSAMMDSGRLVGCQGKWAQVEFTETKLPVALREKLRVAPAARQGVPAGRFRAWLDKICDLQETSCSGLGGGEP
ncbi:SH3 domain-containing protein [Roseateles amylovorans]|uniref:SH3 domain-containing protein n=1 Tax=Roseateles amylovorans TaxID=2978473 RepID=A0ABY6B383_9BURK|nr:SH3 domain-containing protein [Roseateles amylovorans]UXH79180.1 SH3 domain-containing protein [Roseateles amylovorans]